MKGGFVHLHAGEAGEEAALFLFIRIPSGAAGIDRDRGRCG